jgi:hypothetical protein
MPKPLPPHPNVRICTHIKVTGQRCGSPALRGEFFCYFHTRVIKGVQQRVDMRLDSMALLEDCESIQLSIMHVVDGLVKGTIETPRARLILEALRIAVRNAKHVRFEPHQSEMQSMVRQVPDYAHQYLVEHPEYGPLLSPCGADTSVREAPRPRSAGAPAREAATNAVQRDNQAAQQSARQLAGQNVSLESVTTEPAAKRRKNPAHRASRGTTPENHPAPQERKKPHGESQLARAQAAIAGAERGNWRDLRTVLQFAGIDTRTKPETQEQAE